MSENINGWIGVDLDGTLAYYDKWIGARTYWKSDSKNDISN